MSLQAELESGLTELGQTEAKRLEALQVRLTASVVFRFLFMLFMLFRIRVAYPGSLILGHR